MPRHLFSPTRQQVRKNDFAPQEQEQKCHQEEILQFAMHREWDLRFAIDFHFGSLTGEQLNDCLLDALPHFGFDYVGLELVSASSRTENIASDFSVDDPYYFGCHCLELNQSLGFAL